MKIDIDRNDERKLFEAYYCLDTMLNGKKQLAEKEQDKISFAVEQIVKIKETLIKFLQDEGFYENEWYDFFDKIDNLINQINCQYEDKGKCR